MGKIALLSVVKLRVGGDAFFQLREPLLLGRSSMSLRWRWKRLSLWFMKPASGHWRGTACAMLLRKRLTSSPFPGQACLRDTQPCWGKGCCFESTVYVGPRCGRVPPPVIGPHWSPATWGARWEGLWSSGNPALWQGKWGNSKPPDRCLL